MLRGLIFDLDGTLGDTLPVCCQAFRTVFRRRLGVQYTDREIRGMFGPSEEGIFQRVCPDEPGRALQDYLVEYQREHRCCPRPFAGIPGLLAQLRERGMELAIVTGKGPGSARISLETFRIAEHFSIVEAGSPSGGVKPDCMRRVLDRWAFSPGDVAGVGDSPSDILAAREAGIVGVAAAWAPGTDSGALRACRPDLLFGHVDAFSDWVLAHSVRCRR